MTRRLSLHLWLNIVLNGACSQYQVPGLTPSPRGGLNAVALGKKVVCFGGSDRKPLVYEDVWYLDVSGKELEWVKVTPSFKNCKITPRSGASLTAINGKVNLSGPVLCLYTTKRGATMKCSCTSMEARSQCPRHDTGRSIALTQIQIFICQKKMELFFSSMWEWSLVRFSQQSQLALHSPHSSHSYR